MGTPHRSYGAVMSTVSLTVTGQPVWRDGALEVPVAGGVLVLAVGAAEGDRLAARCRPGARIQPRVVDQGPGWWLARAARIEGGFPADGDRPGDPVTVDRADPPRPRPT